MIDNIGSYVIVLLGGSAYNTWSLKNYFDTVPKELDEAAIMERYAAVWTGDNRSFWEHMAMAMPMVLNMGLSGVPFAGPDVGGFAHHTSAELLVRWTQMGAFFPFFRNHSALDTVRQEPWAFGDEVEEIIRSYISLRYRLMPYLYSVFREAHKTGLPVIRLSCSSTRRTRMQWTSVTVPRRGGPVGRPCVPTGYDLPFGVPAARNMGELLDG